MAKRVSSEAVILEYVADTNYLRIASEGVNVEYIFDANDMRIASLGLMVEYKPGVGTGNTYGPPAQFMN